MDEDLSVPMNMVIPDPALLRPGTGDGVRVAHGAAVATPIEWLDEVAVVADEIVRDGGPRLAVHRGDGSPDATITVRAATAYNLAGVPAATGLRADGTVVDERYRLVVSGGGVTIAAASAEGAFRGLTTLRQLITASGDGWLPALDIADGPRFAWRGLSLDVVRTFHPVAEVERVIDMLALHKLNVLHLHLTDDQGWRFEVPGWPRLHELSDEGTPGAGLAGSASDEPSTGADPSLLRPGGHFTDADIARLVAYGRARHVVLVPEVDLPGHVAAAVAAYPELAGPAAGPAAVLAVGTERANEFLRAVVAREAELFPDAAYLHIGADEAWGMDPDAYASYVGEVRDLVHAAGRRVLGWQEHARASTTPDSIAQLWIEPDFIDGAGDVSEAAAATPPELLELIVEHLAAASGDLDAVVRQGASILLSPASQLYFDRPIAEASVDAEQEGRRARLGLPVYPELALSEVVDRDPLASAPGVDRSRIAGVEAAIWCETITDAADLELLLLPRLAGLAEVSWGSPRPWPDHAAALAAQAPAWDARGWGYLRAATVPWRPVVG
jgi:hexosaminidase